jgi:GntR family transcriptional regulator
MHSKLTISQADRRPMYLQLMEQIRRRVAVGDWGPGQEIPSIRALAASTRVSVITIKRAFLELEREGVIVTRQGRGTFVAENVNLGRDLRGRELDLHLAAAVRIGAELAIDSKALADRLRAMADREDEKRK